MARREYAVVDRAWPVVTAEIFTIPVGSGRYLVYAPIRQAAFVGNSATVNFLADLANGIFDASRDPDGSLVDLLRRLEIVDSGPEEYPITPFEGPPRPTSVTLFLTTACNLRCTYCYASAGDAPARSMSLEVAQGGIDHVCTNAKALGVPAVEVSYHGGGEPTANWGVLTGSLKYARQRSEELGLDPARAYCASNGVLRDTQIDWIIENLDGMSISFDGLPAAHDTHRPMLHGGRSSERVIHTLHRLEAAGLAYGVRVTVTADQIPMLADSVEFVCARFHPERIQIEPAYALGRWKNAPSAETEAFIEAYREAQARALPYGHELFFSGARLGMLTNHFCGISQDSFSLSADGNVSACYEVFAEDNEWASSFFYGHPNAEGDGYTFDLPVLQNLREQAVENRDFCNGCFAKWSCAGDCYHKALNTNGDVEFRGTDRCHITRELTKDQIIARIASAGGLFWHAPSDEGPVPGGGMGETP